MSIGNVVDTINEEKSKKKLFVIENYNTDFRKLRLLADSELELVKNDGLLSFNEFEEKVIEYGKYLTDHAIPFDYIDAYIKSGLVISNEGYQKMLQDFILRNYSAVKAKELSTSSLKANDAWEKYICECLSMIKIEDTNGLVPMQVSFKPWFEYKPDDIRLFSHSYIGLDNPEEYNYQCVVNFNKFIKLLEDNGYIMHYEENYFTRNPKIFEIHSFEEYFKQFISTGEYEIKKYNRLTIRVPFSTKNNK